MTKLSGKMLLIRADASVTIGTGHVMRCLALAQAWRDACGDAVFAMAQSTPAIEQRLRSEAMRIDTTRATPGSAEDADGTIETAHTVGAKWIVVDGYQFGAEYQKRLKAAGLKILCVDDTGDAEEYLAELVLNQNAHARAETYRARDRNTRLLLGPRYALLRREFASRTNFRREIPAVGRRVLVTMGGSDPQNLTSRVIEALALTEVQELEAVVVAGGSCPHLESLRGAATRSGKAIRLFSNVSNMAEWMVWADVAVSAAGSTCWEMCFLGLPSLLIDLASNQTPVAEKLHCLGAALHFGNAVSAVPKTMAASLQELILSEGKRAAISRVAAGLVDGRGAERVVAAIRSHGLRLRTAEQKDCRLLWEWANDPDVRQASFSPEAIGWDEHVAWFANKLADINSRMLVATDEDGTPTGQIRLDKTSVGDAEIDVSVAKERRGAGYAILLIESAAKEAFQDAELRRLHAYILPWNRASAKSFEAANFHRAGATTVRGNPALHYILERDGEKTPQ